MTSYKVYVLTCPLENIVRYVGITSVPLPRRLREHLKAKKRNNTHKFHYIQQLKALQLKPLIELVVDGLSQEEACKLEIELIAKYRNEVGVKLLNISHGGFTPSKETRQKMSEANSGSNHYNYGKSLGIEHKKALSVALTGRVFTEEHRQKQSLSGKQRPDIDECIRRIQCQALQQRKPIEQLTKQGQLIADFSSLTEASHQTGNDVSLISRVCNGKSKSAGGYLWRFKS